MAGVALLDRKRQRSFAPMSDVGDGAFAVLRQEGVELLELLGDRGLFQHTIEDVDGLVPTRHVTSLWSGASRRGCGTEQGVCGRRDRRRRAAVGVGGGGAAG